MPPLLLGPIELDPRVFVGVLLTAGHLIEAFDNPIIGWWSDRTRSRWGRRLPFVLFATSVVKKGLPSVWAPPTTDAPACRHQHRQAVFQVSFNSTPTTNTQIFLPSGIVVVGIVDWVIKLADVA